MGREPCASGEAAGMEPQAALPGPEAHARCRARALGLLLGAVLLVVYLVDPATTDWYPVCPSRVFLHFYCPGCGTLRATHRLLHGDLSGALSMNSALVLALPFLIHGLWSSATGRAAPRWSTSPGSGWAILAALLIYTVLRNLPWEPFIWLAPH